jgi:hypothetical protein
VRICLAALLLVATSASVATACPPVGACDAKPQTRAPAAQPATRVSPEPASMALEAKLPLPRRLAPGEVEMPWIWQTLRDRVYSRMPKYEDKGDNSHLAIVLAPVVVKSPSDTIPGIGIAGDF